MHCPSIHALPLRAWLATLVLLTPALDAQRRTIPPGPRAGPARGSFEIVSCSLGCVPGPSGLGCGTSAVHLNEELRITFNRPLALASASPITFQVLDMGTGTAAPALFALDPFDPFTLVWRPRITFDSAGNPLFGLRADGVYLLKLPGLDQDPLGPHLMSIDGLPNRTRLQCVLVAALGVLDPVPGRPVAKLYVEVVTERDPLSGEPTALASVPAENATEVFRDGPVEIVFADVMNPATIANPVTGLSSFVHVRFDPDGDLTDQSDQLPVPGFYTLTIDPVLGVTRARFRATGGLPASGSSRRPGRVVVELAPAIQDLAGNPLVNPGNTSFTTTSR